MADLTPAPAGTPISERARKRLLRVMPHARMIPATVVAKAANPSGAGQWVCVDCGELPMNSLDAFGHADKHSKRTPHRFAWRNGDTADWEEP